MMEELVKALGFEDLKEFNCMVACVDLSSAQNLAAFRYWQEQDGSKTGLIQLQSSMAIVATLKERGLFKSITK